VQFTHRGPWLAVPAILLTLCGLGVALPGVWLATIGGTPYYVLAGAALMLSGALLWRARAAALFVFAGLLACTLVWGWAEVGFDFWALAPRGDVIVPLGILLLLPPVTRGLGPGARGAAFSLAAALAVAAIVLVYALVQDPQDLAGSLPQSAQIVPASQDIPGEGAPGADWTAYGGSNAGDRFSALRQITPQNVSKLHQAWIFHTGDTKGPNDPVETTFEVTPLKIGRALYLCSQHQRLFALDAASGRQLWMFDPHLHSNHTYQHLTCRGVAYHETPANAFGADGQAAPTECARRIFLPTNDARLFALDADTGALCPHFAHDGVLDLNDGMPETTPGFYEPTSPPVITAKMLIIAGAVTDNYSTNEPSGVIRGFDVYSGKLIWSWDSGAADENAAPSATHHYTGNSPNAWITAVADEQLGLVYEPMGVHTPDIWGGNRPALSERYASAVVALDIATGQRRWVYQTVHHDLWDMDIPSQPSLVDLKTSHGIVPALLAPAKTGNIFVLDRRDGTLIVPAPEHPVPQGPAPGDHLSPTQPFSALSFRPERILTGADMWGATMFDQLACRIMFHRLRYEGTFTPPSLQGTLVFPGNLGMFEWGGIAVDPTRQIAIANPMAVPFVSTLIPRGPDNPSAPNGAHPPGSEIGVQPMYGTPYGVKLEPFLSPIGLPCKMPSWGFMAGVDLQTMKIVWQHRNGTIADETPLPLPFKLGVPMLGGPLVTAGGVAFLTSTMDYFIRAYDVTTGAVLWSSRLPAGGQSTPMTYEQDGRQFVVTADGGHGSFGTRIGDAVVAYALPRPGD
jgi:quinoprotein glucose dehydrogenase